MKRLLLYIILFLFAFTTQAQGNFKADLVQGCSPLYVQFTDLTPKGWKWSWDLGNGNTSTLKDPSAIYTTDGKYTVTLKVVDSNGNIYTITKSNYLRVLKKPQANFSASVRKICPLDSLTFSDQSIQGDTTFKKFNWDFGDGNASNKANPRHAWSTPGYKTISLVVTDNYGCSHQYTSNAFIKVITPPVADFVIDSGFSCAANQKVYFTNASSPAGLTFIWNFGDGSPTTTLSDPTHTYTNFGHYNVSLRVQDKNTLCYNTKTVTDAVIIDKLVADFDVKNKTICDKNNPAEFINLVPYYPGYSATWNYGDGNTSTNWAGQHTYANYGIYSVTLEIKGNKCVSKKIKSNIITIAPKPAFSIHANDTGSCGFPFKMKLNIVGNKTANIGWDFGDNQSGSGNFITHTYNKFDSFFVTAIATEKTGCKDTQSTWIKPNDLSVYANGVLGGCIPFNAKLRLLTWKNTAPINRIEWFYKNARIDSGNTCIYKFTDTGNYKIRLRVTNSKGCIDTPDVIVGAGIKIKPRFTISPRIVCLHDSVLFTNTTPNQSPRVHEFTWQLGEGGTKTGNTVNYNYHVTQGSVGISLVARHYGCGDTTLYVDSLIIKTPRVSFKLPPLGCTLPPVLKIANLTTAYDHFTWYTVPPQISKTNDTIYLDGSKSGTFELHMKAINDTNQCADSGKFVLKFSNNAPVSKALFRFIKPCPPALIFLSDSGSDGNSRFWKFHNGDTLYGNDTLHYNFADYGTYKFKRYTVNQFTYQTCVDSTEIQINIPKPAAPFSVTPPSGCTPLSATFTDSAYTKGRKAIWKFGDTSLISSQKNNPFIFNYPFDSANTKITFTGWDSTERCSSSTSKWIKITGPTATINSSSFYTCKNTKLQLSFTTYSPKIKSWKWLADDTLLGTGATADYIVYNTRYVDAQLQITDSNGCTSTIHKSILVRMFKPDVRISSDTSGASCPPLVVRFSDQSTSYNNPIETWLWDFGDGSTSTLKNPSHTFINTGDYNITLKVKSFIGCFATKVFPAYIRIKGPTGSIIADVDTGCTPLAVNYSSTQTDLKNIRWDFGDGYELNAINGTHIYKTGGKYRASAILEDSAGCKLGVQANFQIKTNQAPIARYQQLKFCENAMLEFADSSNYFGAPAKNTWRHNSNAGNGSNYSYSPVKSQPDSTTLIAFGQYGCNDTLTFAPRKSWIEINFKTTEDTLCEGSTLQFTDLSKSDTHTLQRTWTWQNNQYTDSILNTTSNIAGNSNLKLKLKNGYGCEDSLTRNNFIFTGTNNPPVSPGTHYVTVNNTLQQQLIIKGETSGEFAAYNFYYAQNNPYILLKSHTRKTDTSYAINGYDASLNAQCFTVSNTNICAKESDLSMSKIHCTVELKTTPDINKIQLNWTPYIGNTVSNYEIFRADLPAQTFIKIGNAMADSSHYTDTQVLCNRRYMYKIIANFIGSKFQSQSDTSTAMPIYKTSAIKPFINYVTVENDGSIGIRFEMPATTQNPPQSYVLAKSDPSFVYTNIKSFSPTEAFVYNDKSVSTNQSSYNYKVIAMDGCYGSGPVSEVSNSILLTNQIASNGDALLNWNAYNYWPTGVNSYEVQQLGSNDMYNTIAVTTDTSLKLQSPGASCGALPYFRVMAVSNLIPVFQNQGPLFSYSNAVELSDKPVVYIPNVFTPNGDAINSKYKPSLYWAKNAELAIYNRWGEKLYEQTGCDAGWDGSYKNENVPEGIYIYTLTVTGTNNRKYYYNGSFVVLR